MLKVKAVAEVMAALVLEGLAVPSPARELEVLALVALLPLTGVVLVAQVPQVAELPVLVTA